MSYKLKFSKRFDKEYKKLDKSIGNQVIKKTGKLKDNPELGKHLLHTNL